jgi:hypothetical protein
MRGVSHSLYLSLSLILPLSVNVIPAPPYSNAIPAHFYLGIFLIPYFFLLFFSSNPGSLCNQSRYTQLFTFKMYEVINTLIKEETYRLWEWRRNGTEVTHVGAWSTSPWLVYLKANGLQIPLPCANNKTSSCVALAFDFVSCLCVFISAMHGKFKSIKKLLCF